MTNRYFTPQFFIWLKFGDFVFIFGWCFILLSYLEFVVILSFVCVLGKSFVG